ncbi:conserved Plasmodium protein, unknown function [Plasmodium ovale curtisi]|uniref:Uncharacterized protein n=1 Tax=Plasmodium ovale curtisi TaxID=864141 RepID=A0A1A8VWT8_PLAOA|nr:conserved Plasmodium protein, unknown function [Plasmodium ovale curtisi]
MKRIIHLCAVVVVCYLESTLLCAKENGKLLQVKYNNKGNLKNEMSNFQYVFLNENEDSYYINSSQIGEIELKEEIYFYKSFTKVINYFKYRIPTNIHFNFEYDDGDLILLKNKKNGITCKINHLFYSESGLKYLDKKKEMYIKNEPFYTRKFTSSDEDGEEDDYDGDGNDDDDEDEDEDDDDDNLMLRTAICEIKGEYFLPKKLLCYPSKNNNQLKVTFIKNEEYKKLFQLGYTYIYKDNPILLKKITSYFKNMFKLDFENVNIVYYIFNKTMACNLMHMLPKKVNNTIANVMEKKFSKYTDDQISSNNHFLYNPPLYKERIGDSFIIWKHVNKNFTKLNFETCNKIIFNEKEFNNCFNNLDNVYEISLYKDNTNGSTNGSTNGNTYGNTYGNANIFKKLKIRNISSVNRYTILYYNNNDYVVILKDMQFYVYFKIRNVLDLVLFEDHINEINFYYITFTKKKEIIQLYRCSLNLNEINCNEISFIPYEVPSNDIPKVYISTIQKEDISTVYISTQFKIWKVTKDKDGVYNRKIIDSIKNVNEEYFGHINCYHVHTTYERKLLYKYIKNMSNMEENIVGCSYLKHLVNYENSLLISFIENNHFTQHTYHIVKDKYFLISTGKTKLRIKVNELFDIFMMFFIILCVLLSIYTIFKILFNNKSKVGKMKHYFFDDARHSCSSTVDE